MPIVDPTKRNQPQTPLPTIDVYAHHPDWRFVLSASFSFADRTDVMGFAQAVSKDMKGRVHVYHNKGLIRVYIKGRRNRKK